MSEILSEWGEYDIKETIFEFLNEDDKIDDKNDDRYRDKKVETTNYLKGKESSDKDPTYSKDENLKKMVVKKMIV